MKYSWMVLLLMLGGVVATAPAKAKKEAPLSQLFCHAQFAYVETAEGDVLDPNVIAQDRDAAADLQQRLKRTGSATPLVIRRSEADLVFVVRTGRLTDVGMTGGVPRDSNPGISGRVGSGPGVGGPGAASGGTLNQGTNGQDPGDSQGAGGRNGRAGVGAEVGDPDDTLWVYQGSAEGPPLHTWLWRHSETGGLQNPMPLFQLIRNAVEAGCADPGKH